MSLISDSDLRKFLNIKENNRNWILANIKHFLEIDKVNKVYNDNSSKSGLDFIDSVIHNLHIKYQLTEDFRKIIPPSGPFIIIANHPLGGIEGLLILKLICEIRPDFKLQANFLLHRINPVKDLIFPVNPFESFKSSRSSYKGIKGSFQHLATGNSLGIFPAGEVSSYQLKDFKIADRQWQKSSIRFIQKAGVPVIPVYFHGYNSPLFYLLGTIHPLIRTARLPSEVFNKSNKVIKIHIRKPISPKTISSFTNLTTLSNYLRAKTYSEEKIFEIETIFNTKTDIKNELLQTIIEPVNKELLISDLNNLKDKYHLFSQGAFSVYCAPYYAIPNLILEIGRLREVTFRDVGEGTNKSIDLDKYDIHYNHLIIWDNIKKQLAGSYRIGKGKDILSQYGKKGFYISSLFKIKKTFYPVLEESLELGRSFIVKEYQRQPFSLVLLWKGILCFLIKNPEYRYLIGPVSISNNFSKKSKSLIVQFLRKNYFDFPLSAYIKPRKRFMISKKLMHDNKLILDGMDKNLKVLDLYINEFQPSYSIPVLLKKYLQLNGKIIGFNIDPDFNNCLDGLMIVKLADIPDQMLDTLSRELEDYCVKERFRSISLS
jgi:putative hemolysin